MGLSNKEIADLINSNYDEGIRALFDRYYKPLVLFSKDHVGNGAIAEDIVQELFIRLWDNKRLTTIPAIGLSSYLFTSVFNKSKTVLSRSRPGGSINDRVAVESYFPYPVELFDEELMDRIAEELERLPERTRLAVKYVMVRDMKYSEAAQELNISINTLKSSLQDGIKRLRATFRDIELILLLILFVI